MFFCLFGVWVVVSFVSAVFWGEVVVVVVCGVFDIIGSLLYLHVFLVVFVAPAKKM